MKQDPETPTSIYALTDPRDGSIRYIGRTTYPLNMRLSEHISSRGCLPTDNPKRIWLEELVGLGLRPGIVLLTSVTRESAIATERRLIEEHYAVGAPLVNVRNGVPCDIWIKGRYDFGAHVYTPALPSEQAPV